MDAILPAALLAPEAYLHAAGPVTLVETHISWVFLTGGLAYKVKKPVAPGFLDFSTPALRRHFCEEELRLNRRFAPQIYLGLSRVTRGADGRVAIDGAGEVVDYAVRMRAFDREQELDRLLERREVAARELRDLGERLAAIHAVSPVADEAATWCDPARTLRALQDASRDLAALWPEAGTRLRGLDAWADDAWMKIAARQHARRAGGAFRECHGDLHCGNVVRIDGRLTPFDALEFDPALSWIDPVSDLSFLLMDLDVRGHPEFAATTLDAWLTASGDFAGLAGLRLFLVHRALVRALVNGIRASQQPGDGPAQGARDRYLAAALRHAATPRPRLVVMGGVSGSGKSWLAERLLAPLHAIRVRSDVERKRLAGLSPLAASGGTIYSKELTAMTYARLGDAAREIIAAGYTAIVDAACLQRRERDALRALAHDCDVPFQLVWVTAHAQVLKARVMARRATAADPSEATLDVLRSQQGFVEAPDADELAGGIQLDTSDGVDLGHVTASLGGDGSVIGGDGPQ